MREYIVQKFTSVLAIYQESIRKVAILGGHESEPELQPLLKQDVKFEIFGVDESSHYRLDLNFPISETFSDKKKSYDLVLCSQVFEHVFDIKQALENLIFLTKPQGLIWLAFPASNRSHGSPEYFSAGYQPEIIINLLSSMKLEVRVIEYGTLGTRRYYFMNHALRVWPTMKELRSPILRYNFGRIDEPSYKKALRFIRDLPGRIYASFISNKVTDDIRWASESYLLLMTIGQNNG